MSRCLRSLIGQLSLLLVPNMVLSKMNNHEHRTKQTYESYTFQPLMSFWLNLPEVAKLLDPSIPVKLSHMDV